MAKCKYETKNGRCGLKESYAYRRKCYTEDFCRCHEPQTNADRIRDMSDEELAETMYGMVNLDERIHFCQNKAECNALLKRNEEIPEQYCIGCLVEWLKQPAEEATPNG